MIKHIKYYWILLCLLLLGFSSCKTTFFSWPKKTTTIVSELDKLGSSALLIEGTRQRIKGNIGRAVLNYAAAVEKDPTNCAAFFELAKIHALEGQHKDALFFALRARDLDPENLYYNAVLADIYALNDDFQKTLAIEKALIEKHPRNAPLYFSHAETLFFLEMYQEALEIFEKLEKNLGFSEEIAIERQNIYLKIDRIDKAIEEVQKLLILHPENLNYLDYLANLYMTAGMETQALEVYEKMLEQNPESAYPLLLLADFYQLKGEYDEAFDYVKRAFHSPSLEAGNKERIMYTFFSISLRDSIVLEQAYELCRLFIELHPDAPEAYYIYGDFLFRDKYFSEAKEAYLKAIDINPNNIAVWEQVLYIDSQLKDFESMLDNSTKALEYFFEYPVLYYYQAIAAYQTKDFSTVVSAMSQALALVMADNELSSDFLTLKADAYNKLEMYEEADMSYQSALQKNPKNAYALNNYSYSLSVRKVNLTEAEEMSRLSNELIPDNSSFQDTYGWIMYQKGDYDKAYYWLEKAINNMAEDRPVIIEHYGDVLYKLGEKEKALYYWEKASKAGEGSEFLEIKIKDGILYE